MGIYHRFERVRFPPRGRAGGLNGAVGRLRLASGQEFPDKGLHVVPAGDRVIIEMPGGGYGDPGERDRQLVERDVAFGFVSQDEAAKYSPKHSPKNTHS